MEEIHDRGRKDINREGMGSPLTLTQLRDDPPVPEVPLIVERVVTGAWAHFSGAQ